MKKKMTKSELKNILNKDWDTRRKNSKLRSEKNSKASQRWQAQEKSSIYENDLHMETVRRFKRYIRSDWPIKNM